MLSNYSCVGVLVGSQACILQLPPLISPLRLVANQHRFGAKKDLGR